MKLPATCFLPALGALAIVFPFTALGQDAPSRDRSSKEAAGALVKPKGTIKKAPTRVQLIDQAKKKLPDITPPPGILILVEWIEVNHEDFSDWAFDNKLAADATDLRKEVQQWVKKDDAETIRSVVVHARSGQRAKVESITEFMYPTDYDPAEIPNEANLSDNTELAVTPPNGNTYETRNLGTTVEVDPILSEDGQLIDLNLAPELVYHLGDREIITKTNDETQIVTMPTIYAAKATTQVTVRNGGYALVGTLQMPEEEDDDDDRIVLLFVRADAD